MNYTSKNLKSITIEDLIQENPTILYSLEDPSDEAISIFIQEIIIRLKEDTDLYLIYDPIINKHNLRSLFEKAWLLS